MCKTRESLLASLILSSLNFDMEHRCSFVTSVAVAVLFYYGSTDITVFTPS